VQAQKHPDFPAEAQRVREIAIRAQKEADETEPLLLKKEDEVQELIVAFGGDFNNDLLVAANMLSLMKNRFKNLRHAQEKPYFARVDFVPRGGESFSYYIGKWGLTDPKTDRPYVIDWRSPVADLYYTGQVGPAAYQTPGGQIAGEISKKRIFTCEHGELKDLIEADILSQDAYLNAVLADHAQNRLRDVVTTIQAEQNVILRHDRIRPMVVQGVAGAGKTTVALHRITWLLYTYQDTMTPANLMVLAPNPLFLNYVSAVLPELGAEDVLQVTLHQLACRLCGQKLWPLEDSDTLLTLLDHRVPQEERDRQLRAAKLKASLAYKECLQRFLAWRIARLLPPGDVKLAGLTLYTHEAIDEIYTRALSPFPVETRRRELAKHMKERVEQGGRELLRRLQVETVRRTDFLRSQMEDGPERQGRMAKIYAARDERIRDVDALQKDFVKIYTAAIPKLKLMGEYRAFLDENAPFGLPEEVQKEDWQALCAATKEKLDRKSLDSGDLPALILLQKELFGWAVRLDIHHSVVDEAQDLSPFMFDTLMHICRNASFTVVGDLNQGIHGYRGVENWQSMMEHVFGSGRADYFELVTSYRNTVEIMELAGRIARRHPFPGQKQAKPVLRHGQAPEILSGGSAKEIAAAVERLQWEGCATIAILDKLPEDCQRLHGQLKRHTEIPIRLVTDGDEEYTGGVMVMPAHLSKGLEFDGVIMANASAERWPDDALHARLLYVCLTRPLHRLLIFDGGALTALLEA